MSARIKKTIDTILQKPKVEARIDVKVICPSCGNPMRQRKEIIYCIDKSCLNCNIRYKSPSVMLEEV